MSLTGQYAGNFPLLDPLSREPGRLVFATERDYRPAAIKLKAGPDADKQAALWRDAATLSHPGLLSMHETGVCQLNGTRYAYVVMERADEDLSHVGHALSAEEGVELLTPVADALAYVHRQGFVHGGVKLSNVMAVGTTVKLAADTISHHGEPADDMLALGKTLQAALRENLAGGLKVVAERCTNRDPRRRPTAEEIPALLRAPLQAATVQPKAEGADPERPGWMTPLIAVAGLAVLAVGAFVYFTMGPGSSPVATSAPKPQPVTTAPAEVADAKASTPSSKEPASAKPAPTPTAKATPPVSSPPVTTPPVSAPPTALKQAAPSPTPAQSTSASSATNAPARPGTQPTKRVMPEIPSVAIQTIKGSVTISVRVKTNADGSVASASLENKGGSDYFNDFALKAARQWQFAPGEPGQWIIRFLLVNNTSAPATATLDAAP